MAQAQSTSKLPGILGESFGDRSLGAVQHLRPGPLSQCFAPNHSGDNWLRERLAVLDDCLNLKSPSSSCAQLRRLRTSKVRCQRRSFWERHAQAPQVRRAGEEGGGSGPPRPTTFSLGGTAMPRTLIAISVLTATVLVLVFGVIMALSYEINESCTDQMAQQGNC